MTRLHTVTCACCGTPLAHIDMACPVCLPNFYKRSFVLEPLMRERETEARTDEDVSK